MNAFKHQGYTTSDLVDYRTARRTGPAFRAAHVRDLEAASDYRTRAMNCVTDWETGLITYFNEHGYRVITDMTPASAKAWARHYIAKAREWRREAIERIIADYDNKIVAGINAREWDAVDALLNERVGYLRLAVRAEV